MENNGYQHLEPRPDARYRQLFVKGRKFTAERVYRETIGEDPRTPEQVARDLDLPLEAVQESIDYCRRMRSCCGASGMRSWPASLNSNANIRRCFLPASS